MLRRRILASAMASVMAIGSVAVVANAEDAVATKEVKTKDDLAALVKGFDDVIKDKIYDYGSNAAKYFQDAYDYAENVLADADAEPKDYTVAFAMLESVANPVNYTVDDLKKLIDSCKSIYESDNILNEELNDLIYDEDTFLALQSAYLQAESALTSTDGRFINDSYDDLMNAKNSLKENDYITKSQFRSALKSYEALIQKQNAYDTWRRGEIGGWYDDEYTGNYWGAQHNATGGAGTFGEIVKIVLGDGRDENGDVVLKKVPTGVDVIDYITDTYDDLDAKKSISKTTDKSYIDAYKTAQRAVEIFNNFKPDANERANKASVTKLLEKYHKQLVARYATTKAIDVYEIVNGTRVVTNANWQDAGNKYYAATLTNEGSRGSFPINGKDVTIANKGDLLKYVEVGSADVTDLMTDAWVGNSYTVAPDPSADDAWKWAAWDAALEKALKLAEEYMDGNYSNIGDIDDTGAVIAGKENGTVTEWTLVSRYLTYALEDAFKTSAPTTYNKSDVSKRIDTAYEWIEKTGDAHVFNDVHVPLVEAVQNAHNWMKEANKDKLYKDTTAYGFGDDALNATGVVYKMDAAIKAVSDKYADYKYSYQEIYDEIASVKEKIDENEYNKTQGLTDALVATAKALSTINPAVGNEAFTDDREWVGYNRLYTASGAHGSEKALKSAYETLLAEVEKAQVKKVLGDLNNDGNVDMFDAAIILQADINNTIDTLDKEVADFDQDGDVDIFDAAAILKAYVNS